MLFSKEDNKQYPLHLLPADSMVVTQQTLINAPAADLFPLACPVLEYKWIPGWKCELIYCPNGKVEPGCVFNESMSAPILQRRSFSKTRWTAVKYDPENFLVWYKLENTVSVSLNKIKMVPLGDSVTIFLSEMIYQAKKKRGQKIIKNNGDKKLEFLMGLLGSMMKNFGETGRMMENKQVLKTALNNEYLSFSDKAKMVHNQIAIALMRDKNKKRFERGEPISVVLL